MKITITKEMVEQFADLSGDHNPIHLDKEYAATTKFKKPISHGGLVFAFVSAYIAEHWPGCIFTRTDIRYTSPVFVGDEIEITHIEKTDKARHHLVTVTVRVPGRELHAMVVFASIVLPKD